MGKDTMRESYGESKEVRRGEAARKTGKKRKNIYGVRQQTNTIKYSETYVYTG